MNYSGDYTCNTVGFVIFTGFTAVFLDVYTFLSLGVSPAFSGGVLEASEVVWRAGVRGHGSMWSDRR